MILTFSCPLCALEIFDFLHLLLVIHVSYLYSISGLLVIIQNKFIYIYNIYFGYWRIQFLNFVFSVSKCYTRLFISWFYFNISILKIQIWHKFIYKHFNVQFGQNSTKIMNIWIIVVVKNVWKPGRNKLNCISTRILNIDQNEYFNEIIYYPIINIRWFSDISYYLYLWTFLFSLLFKNINRGDLGLNI